MTISNQIYKYIMFHKNRIMRMFCFILTIIIMCIFVHLYQVMREALAYEKGLVEGSLDKRDKFHGHRTPESSLPDNIRSARGALVVILCHVYYVSIQPSV